MVFEAFTSVYITFFLLPEQLHFMNPWPPPNEPTETTPDRQHPGLINITQVNKSFLTHFKLTAREATSQQTLFYSNPLGVIFVSLCVMTPVLFLASQRPLSAEGGWGVGWLLSHCRQLLLVAVHIAFFSAFFLLGSLDESLFVSECLKSF